MTNRTRLDAARAAWQHGAARDAIRLLTGFYDDVQRTRDRPAIGDAVALLDRIAQERPGREASRARELAETFRVLDRYYATQPMIDPAGVTAATPSAVHDQWRGVLLMGSCLITLILFLTALALPTNRLPGPGACASDLVTGINYRFYGLLSASAASVLVTIASMILCSQHRQGRWVAIAVVGVLFALVCLVGAGLSNLDHHWAC
jgi:hypothetical protein